MTDSFMADNGLVIDEDLAKKIDLIASILPPTRYPQVKIDNKGIEYVVGHPTKNLILTGKFLTASDGRSNYQFPIICKLDDIWAY